ncbi:MAG: hypothetical protein WKF40_00090 [Thermoleophilaceae bacterium]
MLAQPLAAALIERVVLVLGVVVIVGNMKARTLGAQVRGRAGLERARSPTGASPGGSSASSRSRWSR